MQPEVFHIYVHGEQRGPYSLRQVNHLAKCKLIDGNSLYWREGMEQWHPVSEILPNGKKRYRWFLWKIAAVIAGVAVFLVLAFGDVTREAWKELTSSEYSAEGAWWKARGLIRKQLASGEQVHFDAFEEKQVKMVDGQMAVVTATGQFSDSTGRTEAAAWEVKLRYHPDRFYWSPWVQVEE